MVSAGHPSIGSGKRQKYCAECAKRGDGRVWGLSGSNPLNIKGAEKPFEEAWVNRLSGLKDHEGPIAYWALMDSFGGCGRGSKWKRPRRDIGGIS